MGLNGWQWRRSSDAGILQQMGRDSAAYALSEQRQLPSIQASLYASVT